MKPWLLFVIAASGILLMLGGSRSRRPPGSEVGAGAIAAVRSNAAAAGDETSRVSPDPAGAPSGEVPQEDLASRLSLVAETDLAAAVALLEALPPGDRQRDLTRQLLIELFQTNPVSAAEFVADLRAPLAAQMAAALASVWVQTNAAGAVTWATGLPIGPMRSEALLSLCADWAAVDPRRATEFVFASAATDFPIADCDSVSPGTSQNPAPYRSQMLNIIGARWGANDPRAAATWAAHLPPGDARDPFVAGLSSVLAESSPAEASDLVASMAPGRQQEDAALTVLLQWGRLDLPAAADWVRLFPVGDFRDKALLNLAANCAEQAQGSAERFLLNWPEAAERTRAIRQYLTEALATNPSRGPGLLTGIQDDSLFQEETERVAQYWLMQDPVAARQWIAENDLEDSAKIRLLTASDLSK